MSRKQAPAKARAVDEDQDQETWIDDEYDQVAAMERDEAAGELRASKPLGTTVSTVAETGQANAALERLKKADGDMLTGLSQGTVPGKHLVANEHAMNVLSDFLVSSGEQGRILTDFQVQYQQLVLDGARLSGMELHWRAQAGGGPLADGSMADRVRAMVVKDSGFGNEKSMLADNHAALARAASNVGSAELGATSSSHELIGKLAAMQAGLPKREDAAPKERAELAALHGKINKLKGYVKEGIDLALKGAKALGAPAKLLEYGSKPIHWIADQLIAAEFETELDELQGQIAKADTHQHDAAITEQIHAVRKAKTDWLKHLEDLQTAVEDAHRLKATLTEKAGQISVHAQSAGDGNLAVAAKVFAEADKVAAQCDVVLGLGKAEMVAAGYATEDRKKADGGQGHRLPIYLPYKTGGRGRIRDQQSELSIEERDREHERRYRNEGNRPPAKVGYSEGRAGANPVVARMLDDVAAEKERAEALRDELGRALNLGELGAS